MTNWMIRLALTLTLAVTALAIPAKSEAAVTRDLSASAQFRSDTSIFDPNNPCIETLTEVRIDEHRSGADIQAFATVEIREFDTCVVDDLGLLLWYFTIEPLAAGDYEINPGANSARLATTIEVCNLVSPHDCLNVDFDLNWTATAKPEAEHGSLLRNAIAAGSIIESSRELAPQADQSARIERQLTK